MTNPMIRATGVAALFALLPALVSCSSVSVDEEAYWDGCITGYADAGNWKYYGFEYQDARRYAADAQYRSGWDRGHHHCYEDEVYSSRIDAGGGR